MARPVRETIDVEDLLVRAYREQVVDRISPAGLLALRRPSLGLGSPTALVVAHMALGTAIDGTAAGAAFLGRAGQMRAVADDYIDLHDAVLSLPRFYADLTGGPGFVVWTEADLRASPHFAVIGQAPALRITPRRRDLPERRPAGFRNGVAVAAPAEAAEGPSRALHLIEPAVALVACGRAGVRPDVSPLRIERLRPRYAGQRKVVGHDPVYETAPATVALERATYAVWHHALTLLAGLLAGLERFQVVGPSAPSAPWDDGLPVGIAEARLTG